MHNFRFIMSLPFRIIALIACMAFMLTILLLHLIAFLFADVDIMYILRVTISVAHTVMFGGTKWYNKKYELDFVWDDSY